ncbi:MAG: hypothetical protein ACTTJS_02570 [Wolinella sp.]
MINKIINDRDFHEIMKAHAFDVIDYLLEREITFSILCNIARVKFAPELPEEITKNFRTFTLFVLAGYTFESIDLDEKNLYFEAGFGAENIASFVTVPLGSIFQVVIQDVENIHEAPLFINPSATCDELECDDNNDGVRSSMEALLSNPENQRFKR